jgi:hypothetical protein
MHNLILRFFGKYKQHFCKYLIINILFAEGGDKEGGPGMPCQPSAHSDEI